MLNVTEEYAVRSMIYIAAQPEGTLVLNKDIGDELNIPKLYLSKVLQMMVRHGLLRSQRGRNGGFTLTRPPEKITLMDVLLAAHMGDRFKRCILGLDQCDDKNPCAFHDKWLVERERLVKLFENSNLKTLASTYSQLQKH